MEVPGLPPIDGGLLLPSVAVPVIQPMHENNTALHLHHSTSTATTTQQQQHQQLNPTLLINFDSLISELHTYQQQYGNYTIASNHPAQANITDILTSYGIENIVHQRWENQLQSLRSYKLQNGHCNVPVSHPTLGQWVANQREYYKLYEDNKPTSPLTKERYEKLKTINLSGVNRWEKRLVELKAYKAEHGHCDVPIDYPKLGVWVLNQRDTYAFNKEDMPEERVAALNALGFNWNRWGRKRLKARTDAWDAQFNTLQDFIKEHGHSNISQHDKDNEKLGKWIKNQRYEYRKYNNPGLGPSRLGRDRIDKLNEIGFMWRLRPERVPWEDRLQALVQFKAEHGHMRVPMTVTDLGKWTKNQRDNYTLFARGDTKKAKLTQEKFDKLNSIGFQVSLDMTVVDAANDNDGADEGEELGFHQQQEMQAAENLQIQQQQQQQQYLFQQQQQHQHQQQQQQVVYHQQLPPQHHANPGAYYQFGHPPTYDAPGEEA